MKEQLILFIKKQGLYFSLQLFILSLIFLYIFRDENMLDIVLGNIFGYVVLFIFVFLTIFRLNRLGRINTKSGKWNVFLGLCFRIILLVLVCKIAFYSSKIFGMSMIFSFLVGYFLYLINLIIFNFLHVQ